MDSARGDEGSGGDVQPVITRQTIKHLVKHILVTRGIPVQGCVIRAPRKQLPVASSFIERQLYFIALTHAEYSDVSTLERRIIKVMTAYFFKHPHLFHSHHR
mmetsp:Transcript_27174/g.55882  ORF Transcript_27174/g.55882 Transcript_27174/m.55882 type:complete len:102 (+) Transcript_27174:458-763(+)